MGNLHAKESASCLCQQKPFSSLSKCSARCSGIPDQDLLSCMFGNDSQIMLRAARLELSNLGLASPVPFPPSPLGQHMKMSGRKGWSWSWCWSQQLVATTRLQKALALQATQWNTAVALAASSYKSRRRKRSTAPAKHEVEPLTFTSFKTRALFPVQRHKHHLMGNDFTVAAATSDSSHHRTSG